MGGYFLFPINSGTPNILLFLCSKFVLSSGPYSNHISAGEDLNNDQDGINYTVATKSGGVPKNEVNLTWGPEDMERIWVRRRQKWVIKRKYAQQSDVCRKGDAPFETRGACNARESSKNHLPAPVPLK